MSYVEELVNTLAKLGPEMFCIVACLSVGYAVRLIPIISNRWIPAICIIAGPTIYPFLTSPGRVSPDSQMPMMRIVFTGLILGVFAFGLHHHVIAHLESKIPGLRNVLQRSDDTKQFRRDVRGEVTENKPGSELEPEQKDQP